MSTIIVFPDVEQATRVWLRSITTSAAGRVYFGTPDKTTNDPFVTLFRVGGGPLISEVPTDAARISFSCWAQTKHAAQQLSAEVASAVFNLRAGDVMGECTVCFATMLSSLWVPDSQSGTPRYIVDATIAVRQS